MSVLLIEKAEAVATLTLNRPEALNALSAELRDALTRGFRELARDPSVRVAILTGAGRAFSAGIDLKELGAGAAAQGAFTDAEMIEAVRAFPGPVIAAVNGFAITGGFELALACDFIVVSTQARFADTHARVGILPGWALSQKLPRLIGLGRAKELAYTGNFLTAEQAEAWGLANRIVEPEELLPTCRALASDMLSCDPRALLGYKQLIDRGFALPYGEALALESRLSREHLQGFDPGSVANRREAIQKRGRDQSGS